MQPVVKLGGSTLMRPDWPLRLIACLKQLRIDDCLLVVGGSDAIEAMRRLDAVHRLDQAAMHWRCVAMLTATAEIACELLQRESDCQVTGPLTYADYSRSSHTAASPSRVQIRVLRVDGWYHRDAIDQDRLPTDWRTTTDAIAIWIASSIASERCIILKSCPVPPLSLAELAAAGIVDQADRKSVV